jgi:dUTP pyrophosphatase
VEASSAEERLRISIVVLEHAQDLPLPEYATPGSAGVDLYAAIPSAVTIEPMERRLIPTGISVAIPSGYEGQVRPRSGLASSRGVTVLNAPGTIDADYRGEVGVLLVNLGDRAVTINRGDRVAQLLLSRVSKIDWLPAPSLDPTNRDTGGYGHSGR